MFDIVRKADLEDLVYGVLGGIPSQYENLWHTFKYDETNEQDARTYISTYLKNEIGEAIHTVREAKIKNPDMTAIINLLDKKR